MGSEVTGNKSEIGVLHDFEYRYIYYRLQ